MTYVTVVVVLGITILVHELGHLLAALLLGIPVERFSLGFGPKIWRKNLNGVEYALAIFPLGGYVLPKLKTEEDLYHIPILRRTLFYLGGPVANLLMVVMLLVAFNVLAAGMTWSHVFVLPWLQLGSVIKEMFQALALLFNDSGQLTGIVGIISEGSQFVSSGLNLITFGIILNVNLAILNLLPLPILDGGQIILTLAEMLTTKVRRLRLALSLLSWGIMIGLLIMTTYQDVLRLTN